MPPQSRSPAHTMPQDDSLCLLYTGSDKARGRTAATLAERLALPLLCERRNPFKLHLVYTGYHLELQYNPAFAPEKQNPVRVDFLHHGAVHRRLRSFTVKTPLARAVGIRPNRRPTVVDATAGLGLDGMCLAWLGCKVILIERNPVLFALLQDGLRRAAGNPELAPVIAERLRLIGGDAITELGRVEGGCETILLDPMYPESGRKAGNKKEMKIIRRLVGDDDDALELFHCALNRTDNRVVVKRPKSAPPVAQTPEPSTTVRMKSGRFDIYLKNHLSDSP